MFVDCHTPQEIEAFALDPRIMHVPLLKIRVNTDESVRTTRGFVYTFGIDDVSGEVALDDYMDWNFVINGDLSGEAMAAQVEPIIEFATRAYLEVYAQNEVPLEEPDEFDNDVFDVVEHVEELVDEQVIEFVESDVLDHVASDVLDHVELL